ncbi:MAG: hypothetical protein RIR00_13, partial [Pseudomonadota bacterium]
MSGPTSIIYTGEPTVILLAASLAEAAEALQDAYTAAADQERQHDAQRADRQQAQAGAAASGWAALQAQRQASESRWQQLRELTASLPDAPALQLPAAPQGEDLPALQSYLRTLNALCAQLEALLAEKLPATDARLARLDELAGPEQQALSQQLQAYASQQSPALLESVRRLLARIAPLGAWPTALAELVQQLQQPLTAERGEALLLELRRQVQLQQEAAVQAAQATVLRHTLQELGYQVEDIGETLFVSGGVVHFQKPGWGDYMVRLRLDPTRQSANFNVVRAVDAGQNERSVLDHLAEDRWCSEFPALLKALAEQGLHLQ